MRHHLYSLLSAVMIVSIGLGMQGCEDSRLTWILREADGISDAGGSYRIRREEIKSALLSGSGRGPELSILNLHCHPNQFLGRGEMPFFLTTGLLDLIDQYTEDEMGDMILVIPRDLTVVEQGNQKTKTDLRYMLPLSLYFLVQDVVGPDKMESEEVKKIFYMFGIPFLPETYDELTSQSRVVSLEQEGYAKTWFNARKYFSQLEQSDLHARLMNEMLPKEELETWLVSRGFLSDEIEFLLKFLWLKDEPPESEEYRMTQVSFDRCSSVVGPIPVFASAPGAPKFLKDKRPDEIRDYYYENSISILITWWWYYCPSPSPSPSPPPFIGLPGGKKPCPSPKGGDKVAGATPKYVDPVSSPSPQRPITGEGYGKAPSPTPSTFVIIGFTKPSPSPSPSPVVEGPPLVATPTSTTTVTLPAASATPTSTTTVTLPAASATPPTIIGGSCTPTTSVTAILYEGSWYPISQFRIGYSPIPDSGCTYNHYHGSPGTGYKTTDGGCTFTSITRSDPFPETCGWGAVGTSEQKIPLPSN